MMSSVRLGEALESCRYLLPVQGPFFTVNLDIQDGMVIVALSDISSLQCFSRCRVDEFLADVAETLCALLGHIEDTQTLTVYLDCHAPKPSVSALNHQIRVYYDQPVNQLCFPVEMLDLSISMRSLTMIRLMMSHTQTLLAEWRRMKEWVDQVCALLICRDQRYPSLPDIAAQLDLTEPVLKAKLVEHGLRFSDLLEKVRLNDASRLLNQTTLRVEQISQNLGYQNSANFTRAFRCWVGVTPSEYRKRLDLGDDAFIQPLMA